MTCGEADLNGGQHARWVVSERSGKLRSRSPLLRQALQMCAARGHDCKLRHSEEAVQHEQCQNDDDFEDQHVHRPIKSACRQDADRGGSQTISLALPPDHADARSRYPVLPERGAIIAKISDLVLPFGRSLYRPYKITLLSQSNSYTPIRTLSVIGLKSWCHGTSQRDPFTAAVDVPDRQRQQGQLGGPGATREIWRTFCQPRRSLEVRDLRWCQTPWN